MMFAAVAAAAASGYAVVASVRAARKLGSIGRTLQPE